MYLNELVTLYRPSRTLRSENGMLLEVTQTRTKTFGDRRFDKSASTLWNGLPVSLRLSKTLDIFKSNLKTHLFNHAFNV